MIIKEQKQQLRQEMKLATTKLTLSERTTAANLIKERLCERLTLKSTQRLMLYYPIKAELDTRPFLQELLSLDLPIGLPVCTANYTLEVREVHNLNSLVLNKYGVYEPSEIAPLIKPESLTVIILPGLAFDKSGHRLGYGAGYYDRFLPHAPQAFKLGIGYDFQLMREIPAETHDQVVDGVLTPNNYWGKIAAVKNEVFT